MSKKLALLLAPAVFVLAGATIAWSHTITFTWTWPTTRQDGSQLPRSEIGGATVYDTSQPVPGQPGAAVICPMPPLPPTDATGTCTTNTIPGSATPHQYVIVTTDDSTPPQVAAPSNVVSVAIPLSAPSAVTDLAATVN